MSKTQPFAFAPRYSSLAGSTDFFAEPIPVAEFDSVEVYVWRGPLPAGGDFSFQLQESLDQQKWSNLSGGDPGSTTEATYESDLTKSWLRAKITLGTSADFPVVSYYAVGYLIRRRR